VVVSAIDNLVKGAAGQAIQNMNLMLGLSRDRGLAVKVLVKLGGTLLDAAESRDSLAGQIGRGARARRGTGGGARRRQADDPLSGRARHREPLRRRPARDHAGNVDAVLKVFAGSVNHELVASLNRAGALAVGLSGIDALLAEAEEMDPALGAVGRVTRSNPALLHLLVAAAICRWWPAWRATGRAASTM
jgi:acetylglutamate kinase